MKFFGVLNPSNEHCTASHVDFFLFSQFVSSWAPQTHTLSNRRQLCVARALPKKLHYVCEPSSLFNEIQRKIGKFSVYLHDAIYVEYMLSMYII